MTEEQLTEQLDALNREVALDWNKRNGYMTGQEWYARFVKALKGYPLRVFTSEEQEIADNPLLGKEMVAIRRCTEAAKKASGIE